MPLDLPGGSDTTAWTLSNKVFKTKTKNNTIIIIIKTSYFCIFLGRYYLACFQGRECP